jgi:hypothetical protein
MKGNKQNNTIVDTDIIRGLTPGEPALTKLIGRRKIVAQAIDRLCFSQCNFIVI